MSPVGFSTSNYLTRETGNSVADPERARGPAASVEYLQQQNLNMTKQPTHPVRPLGVRARRACSMSICMQAELQKSLQQNKGEAEKKLKVVSH